MQVILFSTFLRSFFIVRPFLFGEGCQKLQCSRLERGLGSKTWESWPPDLTKWMVNLKRLRKNHTYWPLEILHWLSNFKSYLEHWAFVSCLTIFCFAFGMLHLQHFHFLYAINWLSRRTVLSVTFGLKKLASSYCTRLNMPLVELMACVAERKLMRSVTSVTSCCVLS